MTTRKPENQPLVLKPQWDNDGDTHDRHTHRISTREYEERVNNTSYQPSLIQSILDQYNAYSNKMRKQHIKKHKKSANSKPSNQPSKRINRKPLDLRGLGGLIAEEYQYRDIPGPTSAPDQSFASLCPIPDSGCSQRERRTDACWTPVISHHYSL